MNFSIKAWWTPKAGYDATEYEDAYHVGEREADAPLRVAVADGATGATFSGLWARLLTQDYTSGRLTPDTLTQRLPFLVREWNTHVQTESLPWYAQAKVDRDGSYAALIGLTLSPRNKGYHVVSFGDCAFFHLRPTGTDTENYTLLRSVPYVRWEDFGSSPVLIGTMSAPDAYLTAHWVVQHGQVEPGDILYLMSDALAAWFLREIEKERTPWKWLAPLELPMGDKTLTTMVRELRDSQRLKNDDITVVSIRC